LDAQAVSLSDTWPAGFTQGTITPRKHVYGRAEFYLRARNDHAGATRRVTVTYTVAASVAAGGPAPLGDRDIVDHGPPTRRTNRH
jgi:hypothetical protein